MDTACTDKVPVRSSHPVIPVHVLRGRMRGNCRKKKREERGSWRGRKSFIIWLVSDWTLDNSRSTDGSLQRVVHAVLANQTRSFSVYVLTLFLVVSRHPRITFFGGPGPAEGCCSRCPQDPDEKFPITEGPPLSCANALSRSQHHHQPFYLVNQDPLSAVVFHVRPCSCMQLHDPQCPVLPILCLIATTFSSSFSLAWVEHEPFCCAERLTTYVRSDAQDIHVCTTQAMDLLSSYLVRCLP